MVSIFIETIQGYELNTGIDNAIKRLQEAKRTAEAELKKEGYKLEEWDIAMELETDRGYYEYDTPEIEIEILARKKRRN